MPREGRKGRPGAGGGRAASLRDGGQGDSTPGGCRSGSFRGASPRSTVQSPLIHQFPAFLPEAKPTKTRTTAVPNLLSPSTARAADPPAQLLGPKVVGGVGGGVRSTDLGVRGHHPSATRGSSAAAPPAATWARAPRSAPRARTALARGRPPGRGARFSTTGADSARRAP